MDENLYKSVPIKVQKKSGFDKSHFNLLTTQVGTLTPILADEVIPNETVNLKLNLSASLPPLASETFMKCDLKAEAFFVPYRLCYGGYQDWFCGNKLQASLAGSPDYDATFPVLKLVGADTIKAGSLSDYLGLKTLITETPTNGIPVNPLPYIAYHKIYDDWYRNSLIQKPVFLNLVPTTSSIAGNASAKWNCSVLPKITYYDSSNSASHNQFTSSSDYAKLGDGKYITDLRQRNFGLDYFTTATPNAQNGEAQKVSFNITGSSTTAGIEGSGNFTIAALRAANSMQQFLERNNLAGNRYVDNVKAIYGANLSDGIAQRPLLLGSASFNVYTKGIYQTANNETDTGSSIVNATNNPFAKSVGATFGNAYASGSDFIINGFTANEAGIIMVIVSLVPKVTYATGISRMLQRYINVVNSNGSPTADGKSGLVDLANPMLQNVGNQPIFAREFNGNPKDFTVFGYADRYADWKDMPDELHGIVRDGESLQSFALQRSFNTSAQTIGSDFLQIPTNYLDQVAATTSGISPT